MKVIAINGSSKREGNTAFALSCVTEVLKKHQIEIETIEIGAKAMHGCIGCNTCFKKKNRRCVFDDDILNSVIDKVLEADGLLVRKVYAEVPPRVEYTLTGLGCSLQPIMDTMAEWGNMYKQQFSSYDKQG